MPEKETKHLPGTLFLWCFDLYPCPAPFPPSVTCSLPRSSSVDWASFFISEIKELGMGKILTDSTGEIYIEDKQKKNQFIERIAGKCIKCELAGVGSSSVLLL